jgi:MerR family transcriptional regulator, light-induced transcriptional regulator
MYTIKQAAVRSGVNVPLLRAWERRYGIVAPARTDSGYRLYDDEAIGRLRAMRALVDEGWSARQAAERVAAATPDQLATLGEAPERPAVEPDGTAATFVEAAARMDGAAIERALDEMFASGSFERVVEDRLYPALEALGDAWATGRVDVAGEHAASSAAVRRLSMAFEAAGTAPTDQPPILVGLPPGVRHEVAALAFATAARRAGLPILYLGADVPVASWTAAVERTSARAVAFGVVMDRDVAAADAVVTTLSTGHPQLVIAVGGHWSGVVGDGRVLRLPNRLSDAVDELRRAVA